MFRLSCPVFAGQRSMSCSLTPHLLRRVLLYPRHSVQIRTENTRGMAFLDVFSRVSSKRETKPVEPFESKAFGFVSRHSESSRIQEYRLSTLHTRVRSTLAQPGSTFWRRTKKVMEACLVSIRFPGATLTRGQPESLYPSCGR